MFGMFLLIGLAALLLAFPLMLVGLVLRVAFKILFLPFEILGALIGIGILGIVLIVLGIAFGAVIGAVTLAGLAVAGMPVILAALAVWILFRLLRGKKHTPAAGQEAMPR